MFGSGWLFRLALGLRLRRARRVRRRRARAAGDRGAAVGGPGVAAAVVVAGVEVDGGAIDGAAAVVVHGDGGVAAEGLGAAAVVVAGEGGVGPVVFHQLELICTKTIPKSEIQKNFEVPNALCLHFEFRRTRQIRLCDQFNAFLIDVGWRRDGRAFFLMRRWRSFRLAKNVSEGSVLSFWTTGDANTFYVEVDGA